MLLAHHNQASKTTCRTRPASYRRSHHVFAITNHERSLVASVKHVYRREHNQVRGHELREERKAMHEAMDSHSVQRVQGDRQNAQNAPIQRAKNTKTNQ